MPFLSLLKRDLLDQVLFLFDQMNVVTSLTVSPSQHDPEQEVELLWWLLFWTGRSAWSEEVRRRSQWGQSSDVGAWGCNYEGIQKPRGSKVSLHENKHAEPTTRGQNSDKMSNRGYDVVVDVDAEVCQRLAHDRLQ